MTATTSTFPEVRQWLVDGLRGRLGSDVQVGYREPNDIVQQRRGSVWLGRVVAGDVVQPSLQAVRIHRDETYEMDVFFVCATDKETVDAERRVARMYGALEDILADDPKPDIDGVLYIVVDSFEMETEPGQEGPDLASLKATITVKARLD